MSDSDTPPKPPKGNGGEFRRSRSEGESDTRSGNGTEAGTATGSPAPQATASTGGPEPQGARDRRVRLDTSRMKSSYCNVCNATSTREEVVLNFGLNQSWDRPEGDLEIEIQHRIIMSPVAARKLKDVLDELIGEYESRYGPLKD